MRTEPTSQLGIDLGGTKVAFLWRTQAQGPARAQDAQDPQPPVRYLWPRAGDLDADIGALRTWCGAARDRCPGPIGSVGAAMPATLDARGRVVAWPSRPHWVGFGVVEFLEREFAGAVVRWADDANLAALAEANHSGLGDLGYIGVGTGVGGGLVLDGQIRPALASGCEIGHVIIDLDGPACRCGRQGCVQAIASGPATLRRAGHYRGGQDAVSAAELSDGFDRRDSWAVSALTESARALAAVVVNLGELLGVERVRIGGGFGASVACLIPAVAGEAARLGRPGHPQPGIEAAVLGADSSLHGALLLAGRE